VLRVITVETAHDGQLVKARRRRRASDGTGTVTYALVPHQALQLALKHDVHRVISHRPGPRYNAIASNGIRTLPAK